MTIKTALELNPNVRGILLNLDYLGFDTIGQAVRAIVEHDDFAQRWDCECLNLQRILEVWRNQVCEAVLDQMIFA